MAIIYKAAECSLVWPTAVARAKTALIPKKNGQWRGIGIFAATVRLYTRARVPTCQDWERANQRPFFAQGAGRTPLDPIWRAAVRAEAAKGRSGEQHAAAVAVDVAAFFESVDWALLERRALASGFSPVLLRMALCLYGLPRHVEADGVATKAVWPTRGIAPGCPWAMSLAKVYVMEPLDVLASDHPTVELQVFVDDITVDHNGTKREMVPELAKAAVDLIDMVPAALCSDIAAEKVVIVASSDAVAASLRRILELPTLVVQRSAVLLGGDYAAGRKRRQWRRTAGRVGGRAPSAPQLAASPRRWRPLVSCPQPHTRRRCTASATASCFSYSAQRLMR